MSGTGIAVRRALLSVADKTGVVAFAERLHGCGVEILSTGGTAAKLRAAGVPVSDVAEQTGFGTALGGRVKTLHPALLGAILYDRDRPEQLAELEQLGGRPIDLVAVNYYPFAQGACGNAQLAELVELIDIGGPTMARSAAKNHRHVAVVTDPADYDQVAEQIERSAGAVARSLAAKLAVKAFARNIAYEQGIAGGLAARMPADTVTAAELVGFLGAQPLRYGENPQQAGAVAGAEPAALAGQQLSYNNLQDAVVAWRAAAEHDLPCCAIIKHAIPCGMAVADSLPQAYRLALAADPVSAYGGVIACNRTVDVDLLDELLKQFAEVLVAPDYTEQAAQRLSKARRLKALRGPLAQRGAADGRIFGELVLYQQRNDQLADRASLRSVTKRQADAKLTEQLLFAWRVVKHTRSNAIVICSKDATLGIGAGQTSRVDAANIAVSRAQAMDVDLRGAVAASDAFFPFVDGVEALAAAGVSAVIQPGGSKRDAEVIACADAAGMVMMFTGLRHFSH